MKTIIEMAHEAGLGDAEGWINEEYDYKNEILAFAALVRAEAQAEERDECACLCDALERTKVYGAKECAEGIRARGNA